MCHYLHTEERNVSSYHSGEKIKQQNFTKINPVSPTMIVRIHP